MRIIRSFFQNKSGWDVSGQCHERIEAITILCFDLESNNVGFQGMGFFTVTYSFIGTVSMSAHCSVEADSIKPDQQGGVGAKCKF